MVGIGTIWSEPFDASVVLDEDDSDPVSGKPHDDELDDARKAYH